MGTIKNLRYRTKRFFQGESGIVERLDEAPSIDSFGQGINYYKDNKGNLPKGITFRNPLGKLVTRLSSMVLVPTEMFLDMPSARRRYKPYEIGDQFP